MAVPEKTPYIEHTGNGVTTSFSLGFQCESKDHLIVLVDEIEPPIATWSLTGGNVVFTTAPAAGTKITLQRNTPFGRTTDYQSFNNSFRPQSVNGDFDRVWLKLQELGVANWLMKQYVDKKDDELKAYLMEEIRKQGVALDQLDDYYNYLMQRLAQIAVDKGWDAAFVVDASGKSQQEINTFLKKRVAKSKADLVGTMIASDGDIVLLTSLNAGEYSGGGEFVYDSSLSSIDDGYMIINGFKRNFGNGFLQIEWFGGKPFTDCTAAYKRAVAFLKANPVRPASYSRGGYFGIQFNAGVYLISENIKFDNMAGFTVKGSGVQATTIVYTTNSGTFYDYVGYTNIHFSDMTVQCGTYDPVTQYVINPSTRNAVCNDFDGTNGGTKYTEDNIRYVGWDRVYKTTKTTINCDMHSYNRISYEENNVVWENSNVNAVSWEFNQCYTHSIREAVLLNPCNTTRFVGGDHINPAPFFKLNVGGHGSSCTFSELRFEFWYDRDGVIEEFKYLDVTRLCQGTVFENCSTFAVGSNPSTRQTGYVSGNFDIKFKNCKLYGYWEALGDVYSRAAKSMLTFEDCLTVPVINHIYGTEVVKSPIGVNYIRQNTQEAGAITGTTVNRFYRGAVLCAGSHLAISKEPMIDTFQVREYVNGTFTHTFPVWNVAPFVLQLSKIRLAIHKDNATNPLDVKLYSDEAKTQLIATHSITAPISTANRIYTIVDVLPSSFTNTPIFSGATTNIYMELSAPSAAAGTCYVNVEFEYMHVGFST